MRVHVLPLARGIFFGLMFVLFLYLAVALAFAQTGPQVQWDQGSVTSASQAQGFTYRLYVTPAGSTTPNAPVVLTAVLCGGQAPSVQCATVLPASANAALITGAKAVLTASDGATGVESPQSLPFSQGAAAPTGLRITQVGP